MTATELLHRVLPKQPPLSPETEPLLSVLAKLHLIPFTAESVLTYKQTKLQEVASKVPPDMSEYKRVWQLGPRPETQFLGVTMPIIGTAYGNWTNPYGSASGGDARIMKEFHWERVSLTDYEFNGGRLPSAVAKTVTSIANDVPNAVFSVDQMRSGKEEVYDPFLVVKSGNEEFTIAVWDETYLP